MNRYCASIVPKSSPTGALETTDRKIFHRLIGIFPELSRMRGVISTRTDRKRRRPRTGILVLLMSVSIVTVALLTYQDVKHRYAESIEDYAQAQQTLARSVANNLAARLDTVNSEAPFDGKSFGSSTLPLRIPTDGMRAIEQPGALVILLFRPGATAFESLDGRLVHSALLQQAVTARQSTLRLPRQEAEQLGLPRRAAVAGIAQVHSLHHGELWVAAVASAYRAREREDAAGWRMVIAVLVASGAVLLLGGVALYWQRRELYAEHALAVEDLRRRREAELERTSRVATIGTLAMGITHELATPLGIISARAEQLVSKVLGDPRSERSVRVIQEQAEHMDQIIRGMLGLARGQSMGAKALTPSDVSNAAVALVEHRFTAAGVMLQVEEAEIPYQLRGDHRLLEHALVNLLLNACDACMLSPQGNPCVNLSVRATESVALFRVIDNGSGISAEAAARAMEPFFTTKPLGQGAGLGLAIAHEIVKSHHGTLRISPRAEGGTCAEITLPLLPEDIHVS